MATNMLDKNHRTRVHSLLIYHRGSFKVTKFGSVTFIHYKKSKQGLKNRLIVLSPEYWRREKYICFTVGQGDSYPVG